MHDLCKVACHTGFVCKPPAGKAIVVQLVSRQPVVVQVRSLASETARQSEHPDRPSLAWFAADFQEEMSAFDGSLLVHLFLYTHRLAPIKPLLDKLLSSGRMQLHLLHKPSVNSKLGPALSHFVRTVRAASLWTV